MKRYKAAREALRQARDTGDANGEEAEKSEMDVLVLFKKDMGAYLRLYTFLSQIFDYGNTAIEGRSLFYKRLLPLLEFEREREGIDLSRVKLTHHTLRNLGRASMALGDGESPKLDPLSEAGSGAVQETQKAWLRELIERVNSLFEGELSDDDKLVYVNHVIMGKLLESRALVQQAENNTKSQFDSSPDIDSEINSALIGALDAHTSMSTQALNSAEVRAALKDILLNHAGLWQRLREKGQGAGPGSGLPLP